MQYERTIEGIGFDSGGEHAAYVGGLKTKAYAAWCGMLSRCYGAKSYKAVDNCEVHEEWHDFQNFAEWFNNNPFSDKGYYLNKSLLVPKSTIYSKETVCLLPPELAKSVLVKGKKQKNLLGTHWKEDRGKWYATVGLGSSKAKFLGVFNTEIEAHNAFVEAKNSVIRSAADDWAGLISDRAYEALKNYDVRDFIY
ncbi:hypothetical protein [uncultured Psychrobacter sp.]|uniref:hypothetical protein n=1 Tax=uncultured Psychrobacter sp. TaxID=259303 RepID=UPI002594CF19|nr:hypothetical protein [uncultured Psychrobacter sp.]